MLFLYINHFSIILVYKSFVSLFFMLLYYSIQQSKKGWSTEIATFLPTAHTKHKKLLIEKEKNKIHFSFYTFCVFFFSACFKIYISVFTHKNVPFCFILSSFSPTHIHIHTHKYTQPMIKSP